MAASDALCTQVHGHDRTAKMALLSGVRHRLGG
jgi:hypothetical protein